MINYYALLEVDRNASITQIVANGKRLKKDEIAIDNGEISKLKIAQIETGLEILSEPVTRAEYDIDLDRYTASLPPNERIDYSEFLFSGSDSWESLIPAGIDDPVEKISYLFDKITRFKTESLRLYALSYICLPSAIATAIPVCFIYGKSGAGKSQPCKFAAKVWNNNLLTNNSTYTSLRNQIQKDRYFDPTQSHGERNYILAWDDIQPERMHGEGGAYSLLKAGYSRSSSIITIAGKDGENLCFDVFGAKIFSSIHPYFSLPKLSELKRRLLIIPMEKSSEPVCDFDEIDWRGAWKLLTGIWSDRAYLSRYAPIKKSLRTHLKNNSTLSIDRQNLFLDLMTTGIVLGLFVDHDDAVSRIEELETMTDNLINHEQDGLLSIIRLFIEDTENQAKKTSSRVFIRPESLKLHIMSKAKNGELDYIPRRGEIPDAMRSIGYRLDNNLGCWIKTS